MVIPLIVVLPVAIFSYITVHLFPGFLMRQWSSVDNLSLFIFFLFNQVTPHMPPIATAALDLSHGDNSVPEHAIGTPGRYPRSRHTLAKCSPPERYDKDRTNASMESPTNN